MSDSLIDARQRFLRAASLAARDLARSQVVARARCRPLPPVAAKDGDHESA